MRKGIVHRVNHCKHTSMSCKQFGYCASFMQSEEFYIALDRRATFSEDVPDYSAMNHVVKGVIPCLAEETLGEIIPRDFVNGAHPARCDPAINKCLHVNYKDRGWYSTFNQVESRVGSLSNVVDR